MLAQFAHHACRAALGFAFTFAAEARTESCAMPRLTILGLPFFDGTVEEAAAEALRGGLTVAPAGPTMADEWVNDASYRAALLAADLVLADSGAMALFWNLRAVFTGAPRIRRISGLRLLDALLGVAELRERKTFWVMPGEPERDANLWWLRNRGFSSLESYVAPNYPRGESIFDPALLSILETQRPEIIFINIGGGAQEPLGAWLKSNLTYRPAIICTGAAIAFRSGLQAPIPLWADAVYLGWLLRILRAPRRFLPRYVRAVKLAWLVARYGSLRPRNVLCG
jgi:UDP-N-acetyl-D-mannosaminuronic acid transferase (WecB/TagA/CpsF family)